MNKNENIDVNFTVEFMKENNIFYDTTTDTLLITDETPLYIIEDIRFKYKKVFKTKKISNDEFLKRLEEHISNKVSPIIEDESEETEEIEDLLKDSSAPVVQMLNATFIRGIRAGASDIHFEPYSKGVKVRFRIDGHLQDVDDISQSSYQQLISRVKVIGKMNVSERRLPQDGRVRLKIGSKEIDLRISTVPTVFGERLVLRILDKSNRLVELEELGLLKEDYEVIERVIKKPHGLILVTGPTGAGKSTTLYSILQKIKSPEKNIITIEDPVEYQIDGISQIQVKPKIDLTFANGLRSILRQDPDVIMVGEIRDLETAEIALHASMTGHLVLSTLHTNDAPSSVIRLIDLGVQHFLVAASLECVVAQRLVRKICDSCKSAYVPTEAEKEIFDEEIKLLYKGNGCEECLNTGFKGRIGVFEVFNITDDVRRMIMNIEESNRLKQYFIQKGNKTLFKDSLIKVKMGITTLEEALKLSVE
ncbi:MAG: GspE/PulE family protein [Calditerrivibrio sp.]|nr:GspE/PulE family protein [Calditerrivibrio sp.]